MKVRIEKPNLIPIVPITNTFETPKTVTVYFRGASENQLSTVNELSWKPENVLREKRSELGLTQRQVAEKCGIPYQSYQKFESGERSIVTCSFLIACRVIEALKMNTLQSFTTENMV